MPSTRNIETHNDSNPTLRALSLSALGIVYGDIGTSPLYTFKTVILLAGGGTPAVNTIMGSVSLIIWTLIIIASVKYIHFALRIDNDGEGGILALMSLLSLKLKQRPFIIAVGLMGAALIYGDGTITPAISVLSAVEGLEILSPSLKYYVLPIAITILITLFAIQSKGTATIGKAFGPVMAFWFLTIGILGARGVIQHPSVLAAINPIYGLSFLFSNGATGFLFYVGSFFASLVQRLYTPTWDILVPPQFAAPGLVWLFQALSLTIWDKPLWFWKEHPRSIIFFICCARVIFYYR